MQWEKSEIDLTVWLIIKIAYKNKKPIQTKISKTFYRHSDIVYNLNEYKIVILPASTILNSERSEECIFYFIFHSPFIGYRARRFKLFENPFDLIVTIKLLCSVFYGGCRI